jgi:hypothetical protein
LSADDERWFDSLDAPFTLRRWDEETMAALLSGPAAILRETWFGDLVLDRDALVRQRRLALAPIEHRYEAELHVRTPLERSLDRVLPGPGLARDLASHRAQLDLAASRLTKADENDELTRRAGVALAEAAARLAEILALVEDSHLPSSTEMRAAAGDPEDLEALLGEIRQETEEDDPGTVLAGAGRTLGAGHTTLMWMADNLELGLVVLSGGAGAGKTHLAAHLSGPDEDPAGVLVLGRQFDVRIVDDDIARLADLGKSTPRLLEALEALGLREGRRVPLVIDGINESVEPAAWKDALARLRTRLAEFRHVIGIITVRPKYVDLALPKGSRGFNLDGLAGVEAVAVGRYFTHYKIRANQEAIDWWRPSDPLLLSLFCRTVNGDRRETVEAAELPRSLGEVFEAYLADLGGRIATTMTIDPDVVSSALATLGRAFLKAGTRELDVAAVAEALGDPVRHGWNDSLRFQLEAEEVLVRDVFEDREKALFGYDLLAGHVIAKDLLARLSPAEITADPVAATIAAHPLAEDIVTGLTGLIGAAGHEPTVAFGEEWPLASQVALASARLPAEQLGPKSVAATRLAFAGRPTEVLEAIAPVALRARHPLNATVLDSLLGDLEVWRCDLIWSEWVRERSETIMAELVGLEHGFAAGDESVDQTAALAWLSWVLTTTDKPLRDAAIKALYRLGRCHPELLFARTLDRLGARDQAISAGLMAAAYGVAMASQEPGAPARESVIGFAGKLQARLIDPAASEPTWHWLIREYAYRTTQLAAWISGGEFEAPGAPGQPPLPAPASRARSFRPKSKNWRSVERAFGMDFGNYTIGRLVEGRSNYDEKHPRFVRVSGEIRARVADLGWSEERFAEIDRAIATETYDRSNNPDKVERYGKKYSWAAFYEAAGRISDKGELQGSEPGFAGWRISDVGLDPSFPETIPMAPPELPEWVLDGGSDEQWARSGVVELPDGLLRVEDSDGKPWVVVDGYVGREPHGSPRKVLCFIRGLLALEGWASIDAYLVDHPVEPELVPGNAAEYYCFAGEAPWSATFDSWATAADGTTAPEERRLGWRYEDGPLIELLAVDFNWESYHSILNDAEIGSLPSKAFAFFSALVKLPDRPEFVDRDGSPAARASTIREDGWSGHLLWVREDLLEAYCRERGGEWGWIVWGEREVRLPEPASFADVPDWMREVKQQDLDRFSRVASLAELQLD